MPLWSVNLLDQGFVAPLTRSISKQLGSQPELLNIAHLRGVPKKEWKQHFTFHKLNLPYKFIKSKMARLYLSRREIYNQIGNVDVEVIFTLSDPWAQEFSRYCSRKMGIPYVVRLRGNAKEVRKVTHVSWIKQKIMDYLDARSLKEANLVVPNSNDLAKKAEEWGVEEDKITSPVYNGVDAHVFKPMNIERSSKFTVAYAGRISPEKRVTHLLKIAESLQNVYFLIAGKKQMSMSFPSTINYLGGLPFSEMPKFYNKADLIILLSATEGFPNIVLEAYACGKPVLVTKEAFPKELKLFGSIAELNEFESEIKALMKSDLDNLGRQARAYVKKHYTWEEFGKSIVKHFERLTTQRT